MLNLKQNIINWLIQSMVVLTVIISAWIAFAVNSWDTLTATMWNDLTNKVSTITNSWGNLWIWTSNPQTTLEVNGPINFTWLTWSFCIFSKSSTCPNWWTKKWTGWFIFLWTCPYTVWWTYSWGPRKWCHPTICCSY